MSDRDLINKPIPLLLPESEDSSKKHLRAPALGKLGVRERAREVAAEAAAKATKTETPTAGQPTARGPGEAAPKDKSSKGAQQSQETRPQAFASAYFNQDVEATATVNQRARPMAALRGEEGATDLKKVVLPQSDAEGLPGPEEIGQTLAAMLGPPDETLGLTSLLQRMGQALSEPGMTLEKLAARFAELEAKIEARQAALARFAQLTPQHLARSVTLSRAFLQAEAKNDEGEEDFEAEGNALVERASKDAVGLHKRLQKMLKSKI